MSQKQVSKNQLTTEKLLPLVKQQILDGKPEEVWGLTLHTLKVVAFKEGFSAGYNEGFVDKDTLPF